MKARIPVVLLTAVAAFARPTEGHDRFPGDLIWAKRAASQGAGVYVGGIASFPDGTCVAAGSFYGGAVFGAGEPAQAVLPGVDGNGMFVARYNADGTLRRAISAVRWAESIPGEGDDFGYIGVGGVAAYPDGSYAVAGWFQGRAVFGAGEPAETTLTAWPEHESMFVARFDARGTLAWAKSGDGCGWDTNGADIAGWPDGSCVVAGSFERRAVFGKGEPGETELATEGYCSDAFVARYNADGTLAWARSAGGEGWDAASGIAAHPDGSCAATGWFMGSATFGRGEPNETGLTDGMPPEMQFECLFVARYNADGTLAWAKSPRGGAAGGSRGRGIAACGNGACVVTGEFEGAAVLGAGEPGETKLFDGAGKDAFVANYRADGTLAWAVSAGGAGGDAAGRCVAPHAAGSCAVTGVFTREATFGGGEAAETTLESANGSQDIFVAQYGPDGTLEWASRAGGAGPDGGVAVAARPDGSCVATGRFRDSAVFGEGEPNETTLSAAPGEGGDCVFVAGFHGDAVLNPGLMIPRKFPVWPDLWTDEVKPPRKGPIIGPFPYQISAPTTTALLLSGVTAATGTAYGIGGVTEASPYAAGTSWLRGKCILAGEVKSAPAVCPDGTAYLGMDDGRFYAVGPGGNVRWVFATDGAAQYGAYPAQFTSALVGADGTVYFGVDHGSNHQVYALYPNGALRWKASTLAGTRRFAGQALAMSTPAGTLYFATPAELVSVSAATGQSRVLYRWAAAVAPENSNYRSSPAVDDSGTVYVCAGRTLYAVWPSGALKWAANTADPGRDLLAVTPMIRGNEIYAVAGFQGERVYCFSRTTGGIKWVFSSDTWMPTGGAVNLETAWLYSAPVGVGADGTVYLGADKLYAIGPYGSRKWAYAPAVRASYPVELYTTPLCLADGSVCAAGWDTGTLFSVDAYGRMKWVFRADAGRRYAAGEGVRGDASGNVYYAASAPDSSAASALYVIGGQAPAVSAVTASTPTSAAATFRMTASTQAAAGT